MVRDGVSPPRKRSCWDGRAKLVVRDGVSPPRKRSCSGGSSEIPYLAAVWAMVGQSSAFIEPLGVVAVGAPADPITEAEPFMLQPIPFRSGPRAKLMVRDGGLLPD